MLNYLCLIVFFVWLYKEFLDARVRKAKILAEQQTRISLAIEETRRLEILKKGLQ